MEKVFRRSRFASRLNRRILTSRVIDIQDSKTHGVIRAIADEAGHVGLIYGGSPDGEIEGRWCYVVWEAHRFDDFIAEMEKLYPERHERLPVALIDEIARANGSTLEQASIRLGFAKHILREFRNGRVPSQVATRILREEYERIKKGSDSVAPLDTVSGDMG